MTRDEIMSLAREAGIQPSIGQTDKNGNYKPNVAALGKSVPVEWLERFAELVAEPLRLQIEALNLRLLSASQGASEAVRAEQLYRKAEALLTDGERQAIAAAVATEREACAQVCADWSADTKLSNRRRCDADILAHTIRARGN